jgi:hypothetical protein
MPNNTLKAIGIGCLIATLILLFVAYERYQTNASNVRAMQQSPLGSMVTGMTGAKVEPGVPTSTKYAIFFAVLFAVGGAVCLVKSSGPEPSESTGSSGPVDRQ